MDSNNASRRSALLLIFLTVFIDLLGFGIIIPLLPVYSTAFGASEAVLGMLFGSFSLMQFAFSPMWGRLSDRIGRKPVLVGGLVGTAASYLVFAYAPSLPWLFASRIAAGFFAANVSTAQAYIADVTTQENRAKGMGLIGAAFGLGFTVGPLVGGELSRRSQAMPGFVAAGLSLAAALFGLATLREPPRAKRTTPAPSRFHAIRGALAAPRSGTLILLYFLAIFAFSGFESMFTRFGLARFPKTFGQTVPIEKATVEDVLRAAPIAGRYLFAVGLVSALVQGGLIRRLVPKYGETRLAVAGPLLLAASFVVVGAAPLLGLAEDGAWSVVLAGCALMPVGFGLNNPALTGLISRAAPPDEQGAHMGVSQSAASLARTLGPPALGAAFGALGASTPFFIGAALLLLATAIAAGYRRRFGAEFDRA